MCRVSATKMEITQMNPRLQNRSSGRLQTSRAGTRMQCTRHVCVHAFLVSRAVYCRFGKHQDTLNKLLCTLRLVSFALLGLEQVP